MQNSTPGAGLGMHLWLFVAFVLSACGAETASEPLPADENDHPEPAISASGGATAGPSGGTFGNGSGGISVGTGGAFGGSGGGGTDRDSDLSAAFPDDPRDHRTTSVEGGTVKLGWNFINLGTEANYDGGESPSSCPDPDAMLTPGTVNYENGVWTLHGSGEGFIHGWDQGSLAYYDQPILGDFTFTAKVEELSMPGGEYLDGAAEALINVRSDLGAKQPTTSLIAGAAPGKFIFMTRYLWVEGENKWWYWPAWPDTWPDSRPVVSFRRVVARGDAISAYFSSDGVVWEEIRDNDSERDWYPVRAPGLYGPRYVGLACSARNDRNRAKMTRLPGKTVDCRDPNSAELRASARCVFSQVSLTLP